MSSFQISPRKIIYLIGVSILLSGCLSDTSYAPVVNGWEQPTVKSGNYMVRRGDTVYSIAWAFGLDYRALAAANSLRAPYKIHPGQRLRMRATSRHIARRPKMSPVPVAHKSSQRIRWRWPARGAIVQGYSSKLAGNPGIDIAGRSGEPIRAVAAGEVVYSGDGVRGYGNLLIIKHNDSYLSAYANNRTLLVKLGQRVRAGQTIAQMGRNNAGRVVLHFELRRNGKPVNPKYYLRG